VGVPHPRGSDTVERVIAEDDVAGIDTANVTAWLAEHVGATPPFRFDVIAGGHSNLTYLVQAVDGRKLVLRRPPLGHVLASAHDMGREHRIIAGLQGSGVPIPPALGLCSDEAVNGAPFYVMGYVEGIVVRDHATAVQTLTEAARANASRSLVDTMAAIHAVDLDAAGLSDLGRHEAYVERQLKRWYGQWNQQKTRELPLIDQVHDALVGMVPEQGPATIVHGDYRIDNTIVSPDGDVQAVLDWEICTLGDPLADIGLLQVYWTGPSDRQSAWDARSTTAPGFWDRAQTAERYAEVSGRDISNLDFYVAFGFWKLACVLEGVYARYLGGALGERDASELAPFKAQVDGSARMAAETLEKMT
jgi:aminoglycoside phosphotransferase (APT) family kinase protein